MKRILRCLFLLSLTASLLTSCVRDVVLDAGEKPTVVVECVLNNSDTQELRLNFTKGASKTEADSLTEAVATLIDLRMNTVVGQFKRQKGDLWTLNYTPQIHHQYRLEVQVPGYDLIYAEDQVPENIYVLERSVSISGIQRKSNYPYPSTDIWEEWDNMDIDSIVIRNYLDKTKRHIFLRGSFYYVKEPANSFMVYAKNYNKESGRHEIVDEICIDHPSVLPYNRTGRYYTPPCFNENYPDVQLYPILEGQPLHSRHLIFPKEAIEQNPYLLISGSFTGDWCFSFGTSKDKILPSETDGYLVFASISDNYVRYLKDVAHIMQILESSDMSDIYFRGNVYTNIKGGAGIFAAMREERVEWDKRWTSMGEWEKYWEEYELSGDKSLSPYEYMGLRELLNSGVLTWDDI